MTHDRWGSQNFLEEKKIFLEGFWKILEERVVAMGKSIIVFLRSISTKIFKPKSSKAWCSGCAAALSPKLSWFEFPIEKQIPLRFF